MFPKICVKGFSHLVYKSVACVSGSTVYTCMLNKRGGAEADLTVSRLEPGAANLPLAPPSDGQRRFYLQFSFHVCSASN